MFAQKGVTDCLDLFTPLHGTQQRLPDWESQGLQMGPTHHKPCETSSCQPGQGNLEVPLIVSYCSRCQAQR